MEGQKEMRKELRKERKEQRKNKEVGDEQRNQETRRNQAKEIERKEASKELVCISSGCRCALCVVGAMFFEASIKRVQLVCLLRCPGQWKLMVEVLSQWELRGQGHVWFVPPPFL